MESGEMNILSKLQSCRFLSAQMRSVAVSR